MAYKYDRDLEFLKQLESSDLLDLFEVLVFGKDGEKRHNEKLTSSIEYKRHGDDYAKYAERIAEELQYSMGAIVLRASLKAKESYTKRSYAMCAIN